MAEQKLFGGVAFLLRGNVCCGAWKEFLILRLGDDMARQVLGEEHALPAATSGNITKMSAWLDAHGDGFKTFRLGRVTAFTGANLMKFGPVIGTRLADSVLSGAE